MRNRNIEILILFDLHVIKEKKIIIIIMYYGAETLEKIQYGPSNLRFEPAYFQLPLPSSMWACLVEGFKTLATAGVLNLPDKRVDPGCWLRSGFESPRKQLGF